MSLINDALKKAQHRHGESAPSVPSPSGPAAVPSAPRKGKTPTAKIALVIVGIALLCTLVSLSVTLLVLRKDEPAPVASLPVATNTPAPSPILPAQPSPPVTAPVPAPANATETTTAIANTPPITAPAATSAPIDSPVDAAPVSPIAPAAVIPEQPVVAAPTIQLGTRIQSFVDRLRVTSIRISDTGNKAILNDRLFRVDDIVEPSLGLRLTDIQPKLLTFTDESGETYFRRF